MQAPCTSKLLLNMITLPVAAISYPFFRALLLPPHCLNHAEAVSRPVLGVELCRNASHTISMNSFWLEWPRQLKLSSPTHLH